MSGIEKPPMDPGMLERQVAEALAGDGDSRERLQQALRVIAAGFGAATCTLHEARSEERLLVLRAHLGLPEHLVPVVRRVPFGKGMAGVCAESREAVTICNLQQDTGGVARPGARSTGVAGALVVPLLREDALVGTLGIGKPRDHEYSPDEQGLLRSCGDLLAGALASEQA